MGLLGLELLSQTFFVERFLNALFTESSAYKVVAVHRLDDCGGLRFQAQLSHGDTLLVDIQRLDRHQFSEWTPSAWRPHAKVNAHQRRVLVQICDFICTNQEHAHNVYRFFSANGGRERIPQLEVHVIELPKLALRRLDERGSSDSESLFSMLNSFKIC